MSKISAPGIIEVFKKINNVFIDLIDGISSPKTYEIYSTIQIDRYGKEMINTKKYRIRSKRKILWIPFYSEIQDGVEVGEYSNIFNILNFDTQQDAKLFVTEVLSVNKPRCTYNVKVLDVIKMNCAISTIRIDELPNNYKQLAIKNLEKETLSSWDSVDNYNPNAHISYAFNWKTSNEGYNLWKAINDRNFEKADKILNGYNLAKRYCI